MYIEYEKSEWVIKIVLFSASQFQKHARAF